jgi:hypothetical protein
MGSASPATGGVAGGSAGKSALGIPGSAAGSVAGGACANAGATISDDHKANRNMGNVLVMICVSPEERLFPWA